MTKKNNDALRPTLVPFATQKVTAVFTHLDKPDTAFDDKGFYKIVFRMTEKEGKVLNKQLNAILDDWVALVTKEKGKPSTINPCGGKLKDEDGAKCYWFTAKMRPGYKSRKSGDMIAQRPQVLDAALQPMNEIVGSGSTVRVSFKAAPYNTPMACGVTMRLSAVQVIDLVRIGGSVEGLGFSAEEGYSTTDELTTAPETTNSAVTLEAVTAAEPASATDF